MSRLIAALLITSLVALGSTPVIGADPDGQRFERPAGADVTVTFPDGWAIDEHVERELAENEPAKGLLGATWWGSRPEELQMCWLDDTTRLFPWWITSADASISFLKAMLRSDPEVSELDVFLMELPAGPTACGDYYLVDMSAMVRQYGFTNGRSWFTLMCMAEAPPADRWLSIAETFEFLGADW